MTVGKVIGKVYNRTALEDGSLRVKIEEMNLSTRELHLKSDETKPFPAVHHWVAVALSENEETVEQWSIIDPPDATIQSANLPKTPWAFRNELLTLIGLIFIFGGFMLEVGAITGTIIQSQVGILALGIAIPSFLLLALYDRFRPLE